MTCDCCEKSFWLEDRYTKFRIGKVFCSLSCVRRYIEQIEPLRSNSETLRRLIEVDSPSHFGEMDAHSFLLQKTFRSNFERDFAEMVVLNWNWRLQYEAHSIQTAAGGSSSYLIDFYLPEHGVWIETKGEWRLGGKKKFQRALGLIGEKRLLLLGPQYFGELRTIAKQLRIRYGMAS
jgi:hypothetical protein